MSSTGESITLAINKIKQGYKIRDIDIKPGLVLSPMSGVTSLPFRQLILDLNPHAIGMTVTEFISVEALTRQVPRSLAMTRRYAGEKTFAIQIFGHDINRMRDAALMAEDAGADIVDINSGCPAPKVVRKGGGCELMRQPLHLAQILRSVRGAISVPLTIKFRSGWDQSSLNALEIAKISQEEGVEAITVHGRTRAQLYRGDADWQVVSEIAELLKIPVCGSGDIFSIEDVAKRLNNTKIAGIFIGRGAISNPYVFSNLVEGGINKKISDNPLLALKIFQDYTALLCEHFQKSSVPGKIKQLASQTLKGITWRKGILSVSSYQELCELYTELYTRLNNDLNYSVCE
jgi:tRNA-dihydrouridine synthase B